VAFHRLNQATTAEKLLASYKIPLKSFRVYNPDVRNLAAPLPAGYWYALPSDADDVTILASRHRRHQGVPDQVRGARPVHRPSLVNADGPQVRGIEPKF
jgi:hypothetical protein